jgi:hypothetical protein
VLGFAPLYPTYELRTYPLPPAQEPSDLDDHPGHMPVLSVGEPAPADRKTEIAPHPCQGLVGQPKTLYSRRSPSEVGLLQPLSQVKGRIEQPAGECMPVRTGKMVCHRQQPRQEVKGPVENGHFLSAHVFMSQFVKKISIA